MNISEVSRRTGITSSTLRYYESRGLLPLPSRSESGYREYTEQDVERVETIKSAKLIGFSLNEIRQIFTLLDEPGRCETIALFAIDKVKHVRKEIDVMTKVEQILTKRLAAWESGESSDSGPCQIITGQSESDFKEEKMSNSKIIIYAAQCGLCEKTEQNVRDAVAPCGCSVEVKNVDSDDARALGVKSAPTVVRDGAIIFYGLPTAEEAVDKLRKTS